MYSKNILLVEDNPSDADLASRALEKCKIEGTLIVKEDGEAALKYLFEECGQPDKDRFPGLILLDLNLPGISGMEILKLVREHEITRRIPVVILTTSSEELDGDNTYNLGANAYIRKPVDSERFLVAVNYLGLSWLLKDERKERFYF
jgi:two-component system response regulator